MLMCIQQRCVFVKLKFVFLSKINSFYITEKAFYVFLNQKRK